MPFSDRMKRLFNRSIEVEPDDSEKMIVWSTPRRRGVDIFEEVYRKLMIFGQSLIAIQEETAGELINRIQEDISNQTRIERERLFGNTILGTPEEASSLEFLQGDYHFGLYEWQSEMLQNPHPVDSKTRWDRKLTWDNAKRLMAMKAQRNLKHKHCYDCERNLIFYDFAQANLEKPIYYLKKLWKSPYVELLCCGCKKQREMINIADKIIDEEYKSCQ